MYTSKIYQSCFGTAANQLDEADYNQLEKISKLAIQERNMDRALSYAGRAAILYGVAGLMLYLDTATKQIQYDSAQGEMVEEQAIHLYALVNFAKKMLLDIQDSKAISSMEDIYPMIDYHDQQFWQGKLVKLRPFIETEMAKDEVDTLCQLLIDDCTACLQLRP